MEENYWNRARTPEEKNDFIELHKNGEHLESGISIKSFIPCLQEFTNQHNYSWTAEKRFLRLPCNLESIFFHDIRDQGKILYEIYAERAIEDLKGDVEDAFRVHVYRMEIPKKLVLSSIININQNTCDREFDESQVNEVILTSHRSITFDLKDELANFMYNIYRR